MTKMIGSFKFNITNGIIAGANNAGLEAFGMTGAAIIKKNLRAMKVYATGYEISSVMWRTSRAVGADVVKSEDTIQAPPAGTVKMGTGCKYALTNEYGKGTRVARPAFRYSAATMKPLCTKAFWLTWSRIIYGASK